LLFDAQNILKLQTKKKKKRECLFFNGGGGRWGGDDFYISLNGSERLRGCKENQGKGRKYGRESEGIKGIN